MRLLKPQAPTFQKTEKRNKRNTFPPGFCAFHPKRGVGEGTGAFPPADPPPPHLPVQVGDAAVTLGGSVELADLLNSEALGKILPYGGAQPVANRQPHAVPRFALSHRLVQKVPADFPDILNNLKQQTQKQRSGFGRRFRRPRKSRAQRAEHPFERSAGVLRIQGGVFLAKKCR